MKVALVAPFDYPNGLADLRITSRELVTRNIQTTIICLSDSSTTHALANEPARVIVRESGPRFTIQAAAHLRRIRPDLVHVYAYRGCGLLPLLAPGPRYLIDVRSGNVTGRLWARLADRVTRVEALPFHGIAVISDAVARYVGGTAWADTFVFPVAFSDAVMSKARGARRAVANAPLRIGYVGSLEPQRCPERLIEVAERLRSRNISCRWLIVGDGRARPRVEQLAKAAGLQLIMDFLGKVPSDSIWQPYADMDIALAYVPHHAYYDNQPPLKTIEAMAAELPTVATDTRGNRDLVTTSRDLVLVPDEVDALADALERLIKDASLRRSIAAHAVAAARPYAIEQIVHERILPAYHQLLNG